VALPGRGMRQKDALHSSAAPLVAALAAALGGALAGGRPYAFVGFSFGAVLAWEVARAIGTAQPGEGPALLCAVSAEGPSWAGRAGTLHAATETDFRRVLREKGGTEFILKDEGMSRMYLPVIRADLALEETYAPAEAGQRVGVPTIAVFGTREGRDKERTRVAEPDAALWLDATSAAAGSRVVALDVDWYVLQEEAGANAVIGLVDDFLKTLA
jgi:surfactin synthase thioesterase subunit